MTTTHKNILLLIALIVAVYYPIISMHVGASLDPYVVHEEQRMLYPYYQLQDPELFKDDYITQYLNQSSPPYGYKLLVQIWAEYFDLQVLYKALPLLAITITIIAMGMAAWKLGGWVTAWGTAVLVLTQPVFSYQITASIPHMFAYPFLACFLTALLFGKVYTMALITILSSLFYPVTTIFAGATMAFYLLVMPANNRGKAQNWSLVKRLLLLGITAVIVATAAIPLLEKTEGYGRYIPPLAEAEQFPESGIGGRYFLGDIIPFSYVVTKLVNQFCTSDQLAVLWGMILLVGIFVTCSYGFQKFSDNPVSKDRIKSFLWSVLIVIITGYLFLHGYFYRFFMYSVPLIYTLLLPVCIHTVITRIKIIKWDASLLTIILILALTLQFSSTNPTKHGYSKPAYATEKIYDFIKTTNKHTLFAGWPGQDRIIDYTPYLAKRRAFIMRKTHYPMYYDYTMEMRKHMHALMAAYLATDMQPVYALRDQWSVDYLIIDSDDFIEPPTYFKPFDETIATLWDIGNDKGFILKTHLDKAIFQYNSLYIIDLHKL